MAKWGMENKLTKLMTYVGWKGSTDWKEHATIGLAKELPIFVDWLMANIPFLSDEFIQAGLSVRQAIQRYYIDNASFDQPAHYLQKERGEIALKALYAKEIVNGIKT